MNRQFSLIGVFLLILALPACKLNSNGEDISIGDTIREIIESGRQKFKTKSGIMKSPFGKAGDREVSLYTLTNNNGYTVKITNYGAIITSILMPDRNDSIGDIVLGYDSLAPYMDNNPYFGAIVGRYANRIAKGRFSLGGKTYQLAVNNGKNSLHGGLKGFDKVVWDAEESPDTLAPTLIMHYLSKDGEEGYPGNLKVTVTYRLDDHNELLTRIEAETDKPTPVNLCNHSYFNLTAADTNILGHILTLWADRYTEVNDELIPTGRLLPVRGTAMDFNDSEEIGSRISQVKGGYDHNYVLTGKGSKPFMAAQLFDPRSGRQLEVLTTQPGVQFYSGNFLDGSITGKGGIVYRKHYGMCLETQHFPDSPNQPGFPGTILNPGEKFSTETVYRLSVLK
jgi:aldose 1-epimerase